MKALGEAAIQLPWLSPCAASLLALTRAPGEEVWSEVRTDPGCVLLLIRFARPPGPVVGRPSFPALLRDAGALEAARSFLESPDGARGWVDWQQPRCRPVYEAALAYARLGWSLARQTRRCDPESAWVAGLLAPLGQLALCSCPHEPEKDAGLLALPVARRLSRRWRLPAWLAAITGHLGLPQEVVQGLGADADLFQLTQLAVAVIEQRGAGLGLRCGQTPAELLPALGLAREDLERLLTAEAPPSAARVWQPPLSLPLLNDLLRLAAENRRLGDLPVLEQLQDDMDVLSASLEEQIQGEAERLHARKLSALAELAAGAGHEINNPLAVISGQAQYLLRKIASGQLSVQRQTEPDAQAGSPCPVTTALETIIGQAQRVHHVVTDLMQFARPPAPQKQLVDVAGMMRDVTAGLRGLAEERGVNLENAESQPAVTLYADPGQIARALTCLLRNAIEAAPAQGWARLRAAVPQPDRLELIVEDSGRGPPASEREHLFDPFYSGRKAGRGRGLGLPTAWRLARQHGGDVYFLGAEAGLTRFVLQLPLAPEANLRLPAAERTDVCASLPLPTALSSAS